MTIPSHLRLAQPANFKPRGHHPQIRHAFRMGAQLHPNHAAYEFYPTPPKATRALLAAHTFDSDIWEPACGQGHIAKVFEAEGFRVTSTGLVDHGYGQPGRDFLAETKPLAKNIITNPPYGRGFADAFCKHAIHITRQTGGSVAMLVAVQSLCHPTRTPFFHNHPPTVIYALDECTCWPNGIPVSRDRAIAKQRYCWLVWDFSRQEPTLFQWLSTRPFKDAVKSTPLLLKSAA
ncbi:MAG: hypothetical protein ACRBCJ_13795 [Hyphomicrobiaceae bacterium]